MKSSSPQNSSSSLFNANFIVLAALSVFALTATFLVSNSGFGFEIKVGIFLAILILYLSFCVVFFSRQRRLEKAAALENEKLTESLASAETEGKLLALEEANQFFGASLKPVDMFRLVSSRVSEIIPFSACALFLAEEGKTRLKAVGAVGENARELMNLKSFPVRGAFSEAFSTREIQCIENFALEKNILSAGVFGGFKSALIAPLVGSAQDVFGVLALFDNGEKEFNQNSVALLDAIGERVAPLFLSSIAFERSLSNALTDSITNLPNDRAFYLILENQIAESQRFRDDRPLTVLAVDIKSFNELNQKFGHATGDRILSFTADIIKEQLRQMDFLSRSASDEFLAILPTASDEITREIQTRIERAFLANPFEISSDEKVFLKFNFGAASFGKDGETAQALLEKANVRKFQSKAVENSKIILFPKELIN